MYKCVTFIDPVVICPYNKNHFIVKSRLQKHIVKCEKHYPENYKVMCPYNATHRLFKEELAEHIITCSARNMLQSEIYTETRNHGAINFDLHSEFLSTIDCTENWDLEVDNSSIVTEEYTLKNNGQKYSDDLKSLHGFAECALKEKCEDNSIRAPRGFSEAMLKEVNEDSCVEDLESIISGMGIGRGKVTWKPNKLKSVGLGRGGAMNSDL